MALFNHATKEVTAKLVYYGPGLCGKTTNLQWIHDKLNFKSKGKLVSLATQTDRTLFFDFLPVELGTIRGMRTRMQIYTVPGQVFYEATRRMVLKGCDAVVFVADSQAAMLDANYESLQSLRRNLLANEIDPSVPMVIQYNKRDLPTALPVSVLNSRLNPRNLPHFEAVACQGTGVEETLRGITKLLFKSLSDFYGAADAAATHEAAAPSPSPPAASSPEPPARVTVRVATPPVPAAPRPPATTPPPKPVSATRAPSPPSAPRTAPRYPAAAGTPKPPAPKPAAAPAARPAAPAAAKPVAPPEPKRAAPPGAKPVAPAPSRPSPPVSPPPEAVSAERTAEQTPPGKVDFEVVPEEPPETIIIKADRGARPKPGAEAKPAPVTEQPASPPPVTHPPSPPAAPTVPTDEEEIDVEVEAEEAEEAPETIIIKADRGVRPKVAADAKPTPAPPTPTAPQAPQRPAPVTPPPPAREAPKERAAEVAQASPGTSVPPASASQASTPPPRAPEAPPATPAKAEPAVFREIPPADPPPRGEGLAENQWLYLLQGRQRGPIDIEDLVDLVLTSIPESTKVWHAGLEGWVQANQVREIAEEIPPPLPIPGAARGAYLEDDMPDFNTVPPQFRTVLVADEDESFRKYLGMPLAAQGFTIHEAADGAAAWQLAVQNRPWLILADVSMPELDGFEFCRRVRNHPLLSHTPLLFISGSDKYKDRYRALQIGADDFLSKQMPIRELLMRIQLLLTKYSDLGDEKRGKREVAGAFEGRVEVFGAPALLQMCAQGRLSGLFTGLAEDEVNTAAVLGFREGEIISATHGDISGVEAVYAFLGWEKGSFQFTPGDPGQGEPLAQSVEHLLLEGCRLLDESRQGGEGGEALA